MKQIYFWCLMKNNRLDCLWFVFLSFLWCAFSRNLIFFLFQCLVKIMMWRMLWYDSWFHLWNDEKHAFLSLDVLFSLPPSSCPYTLWRLLLIPSSVALYDFDLKCSVYVLLTSENVRVFRQNCRLHVKLRVWQLFLWSSDLCEACVTTTSKHFSHAPALTL